jgi:hypothetical protein
MDKSLAGIYSNISNGHPVKKIVNMVVSSIEKKHGIEQRSVFKKQDRTGVFNRFFIVEN